MDLSINEGTLVVTCGPGDSLQNAIVITYGVRLTDGTERRLYVDVTGWLNACK